MMKRTLLFFGVLVLLVALLWRPLEMQVVKYSVQHYIRKSLNSEIQIGELYRKNGLWILDRPHSIGFMEGDAESVTIEPQWHFFDRLLELHVKVENPHLTFHQRPLFGSESSVESSSIWPSFKFFDTKGSLSIEQGVLHVPETHENVQVKLDFKWSDLGIEQSRAMFQLTDPTLSQFKIFYAKNEGEKRSIELDAYNMDCHTATQALKPWWSLDGWLVPEGKMTGRISLETRRDSIEVISANLIAEQLTISHSSHHVTGVIPAAAFSFDNVQGNSGKIELLKPAFVSVHSENSSWNIYDIKGGIDLSLNQDIKLELSSNCDFRDEKYAVGMKGKGNLKNGDMEVDLILPSKGGQEASAHIAVHRPESAIHEIDLCLKNCLPLQDNVIISCTINSKDSGAQVEGVVTLFSEQLEKEAIRLPFELGLVKSKSSVSNNWMHQGLAIWGYSLERGEFEGRALALNQSISMIPFTQENLNISGYADVRGVFDQKSLVVYYDVKNLIIENEFFNLDNALLYSSDQAHILPAVHYFDFETGAHGGVIYLKDAIFRDKKRDIKVSDIKANIVVGQQFIYANDVEAFCNDVYFAGNCSADLSKIKDSILDVDIYTDAISGRISQIQPLLSSIAENFVPLKIPVEGLINLRESGSFLKLNIAPHDSSIEVEIHGALTEGALQKQGSKLALSELSLNFDFDMKEESDGLVLTDIQGTLLVGEGERAEEYILAGDYVKWSDFSRNDGEFDLWVGDKNRDIIRIVGQTQTHDKGVEFHLDHTLSHFADVHPKEFELILSHDWLKVESLVTKFDFKLETLLRDLQRFSRTGLLFLSRHLLHDLNNLKNAEGLFQTDLSYNNQTSLLSYVVTAQNVCINKHRFNHCMLKGVKKDRIWTVDQLQLDNISAAAEFFRDDNFWKINFLGARAGKSLLIGLEGIYLDQEYALDAKVNLLEINLQELSEWPQLNEFVMQYRPKGNIRSTGKIYAALKNEKPELRIKGDIALSLRNCEIQGILLKDANDVACRIVKEQNVEISFPDGTYPFLGENYDLQQIKIRWDSDGLQANARYMYNLAPLWLSLRAYAPFLNEGEILVYEKQPLEQSKEPLVIRWQRDSQQLFINSISGQCLGCKIDLKDPVTDSKKIQLVGDMHLVPSIAAPLLPLALRNIVLQWQLEGNFLLKGTWTINKEKLSSWYEHLQFSGSLIGEDCAAMDHCFNSFSADVDYQPTKIDAKKVRVEDPAGIAIADAIEINKKSVKHWQIFIPTLSVSQFRPGHIRMRNSNDMTEDNAFIIRQLDLEGFSGNIFDSSTLTGKGQAHCANPPKEEKLHPILNIPAEILAKCGLDLSALNPVTGTIHYEIGQRKIFLTKFKDMYSSGKMSKFHLLRNPSHPSYIDFDGNVHVQVRMKQYNLLFKLAELVTVTIQGTWKHPVYTILPQAYKQGSE